jgi:hypothetical protein
MPGRPRRRPALHLLDESVLAVHVRLDVIRITGLAAIPGTEVLPM